MFNNERFSVGIIGAGDIVATMHLPVLLAMEEVSIAWLTDVNSSRANSVARAYRVDSCKLPKTLTDLPYADVLLLSIPYGVRTPYYGALSGNSCALYVEKPFARKVEEHRSICSLFPDYQLACGFQRRSWGPTLQLKELVEANLFGELRFVRLSFGGPGIVVGGRYSSDICLAGGGILMETGVHSIDALLFILDVIAVQVNDVKMIMDLGFDLHTNAKLTLTTQREQYVECEVTVSCLQDTTNCLEFTFDHAVASFNLFGNGVINVSGLNKNESFILSPSRNLYPATPFETFYEHWSLFLNGLRARDANLTSASESILTTEVIEKLYEAGHESTGP